MAKGLTTNRHHIMETRSDWSSCPNAKRLRNTQQLIPVMEIEPHNELTENCPIVPLLGFKTLQIVACEFQPFGGTLKSIDKLLIAINEASKHHSIHKIERDLAQLSMQAIEMQIPYLRGNIVNPKYN
jgi:hypothetical protein